MTPPFYRSGVPLFRHTAAAMRLDQAIASSDLGISRREAKRLLDDARVAIESKIVSSASRMIAPGTAVAILTDVPDLPLIDLRRDLVVIDKPSGLPSQPTRERDRISAVEVLAGQLKRSGESPDLYVVHRIDSGTSGVLVFGRTRSGAALLSRLFAAHEMEKVYLAKVAGLLDRERVLDEPIEREGERRFRTAESGRMAETRVIPLRADARTTLVEIRISTGRTHQIRVHLASAGFPIAGDRKYGGPNAPRLLLHAWKLSHPDLGSWIAEPPFD